MRVEAGRFYRTRDGRKARIYATDVDSIFPIHGAILIAEPNTWAAVTWDRRGYFLDDLQMSESDIIADWKDR